MINRTLFKRENNVIKILFIINLRDIINFNTFSVLPSIVKSNANMRDVPLIEVSSNATSYYSGSK
jgi:hypothetical protein